MEYSIYLYSAIAGCTLVVVQVVLQIFGFFGETEFGGDHDMDVGDSADSHDFHDHGAVLPETRYCAHYVECSREHVPKEAGKMRAEVKSYKIADGDVMHFFFGK